MKQVLQSLENGTTELAEIPAPRARAGQLLIQNQASVVSVGTERLLVEFGRASLLQKARQQPERVKDVLAKIRTDGLGPTLQAVRSKLGQPIPLGYSSAGLVIEVGSGVTGFRVGDRVISNGPHSEVVCVPVNLCAKIPEDQLGSELSFEHAAFTVVASIGLQGVRLASPTLGERFVVTGLGLIGLMVVQLLRANGCEVLGLDFDPAKLELARQYGAQVVNLGQGEDPVAAALAFSEGRGVDGVLITASTKSSEPVHQAAQMCRKRGRIVLVGVTGLELSRADFYEKELSFQVSCSYGPGRYDPGYEDKGQDYPFGLVRWTEQRNFEAVLGLIRNGQLKLEPLITHRFEFDQAPQAYDLVTSGGGALGVVLNYPTVVVDETSSTVLKRNVKLREAVSSGSRGVIGLIGAGNYTTQVLLPALQKSGVRLRAVSSSGGITATHAGRKFGFEQVMTETSSVFTDPEIDTVIVTTRHDSHARYALEAIRHRKHVFVEKPLALTRGELAELERVYSTAVHEGNGVLIGMGFNRRFAPHVIKIKSLLELVREPKTLVMTVNAGFLPSDHWTQDPLVGGGRIIGEACHFVDLLRFLVAAPIERVVATQVGGGFDVCEDKMTITLRFQDGSIGTVHYFANGHKSFSKERLQVFAAGRILEMDNYRKLTAYGWPGFTGMSGAQDKGHEANLKAFIEAIRGGHVAPIPFSEVLEVHRACLDAIDSARES
jgi:predicted dehydrogenase/threonine dehydrogenase-like Zn-dependent dehydrogenase